MSLKLTTLLQLAGYEVTGTGGGCTAYTKAFPNAYVIITEWDDATAPTDETEKVGVGVIETDTGFGMNYEGLVGNDGVHRSDMWWHVCRAEEVARNHREGDYQ